MYRELFRLKKGMAYFLWALLSLFILFYLSIFYYHRSYQAERYWFHPIEKYSHYNEIPNKIEALYKELENLNQDNPEEAEQIDVLEETIAIYRYLYQHRLAYENVVESNGIGLFAADRMAYMTFMTMIILTLSVGLAIFLSTTLNNYLYLTGIHRLLYGRKESRLRIVSHRLMVIVTITAISTLLLFLLIIPLSKTYHQDYRYILIFGKERIFHIKTNLYLLLNIISAVFVTLFYTLLAYAISLLIRNPFASVGMTVLVLILLQVLPLQIDQPYIQAFSQFPLYLFDLGITLHDYLAIQLAKWGLLIGLILLSFYVFNRKDLH